MTTSPESTVDVRLPPPPPPPSRAKQLRHWLKQLLLGLMGAVAGFVVARWGIEAFAALPGAGWKIALVAGLPLAWWFAVAVHELGHLVGGWLAGGRFVLWTAGPLKVQRTPAGLRVGLNRSVNVFGGLAICMPLDAARMTPNSVAVTVLAGPAFSFLLAAAALGGPQLGPGLSGLVATPLGALLHNLLLCTGALSALLLVVALWPAENEGFKSDGKRVRDLLRGDARSDQEAALLLITAAALTGTRPRDYDPGLVARATALRDGSLFDRYASLAIYYHAVDRGEWARAQALLDHALGGQAAGASIATVTARCEYAWLLATRAGDATAARAWLQAAGPLEFEPAIRLRAEAAVLAAEGQTQAAAAKAREALDALSQRTLSQARDAFSEELLAPLLRA